MAGEAAPRLSIYHLLKRSIDLTFFSLVSGQLLVLFLLPVGLGGWGRWRWQGAGTQCSFPPSSSGRQAEGQGDCPPPVSCMLSAPAICQAVPGRPRLLSVTLLLTSSCPRPLAPLQGGVGRADERGLLKWEPPPAQGCFLQ